MDNLLHTERFWELPAEERAYRWQHRFWLAVIIATVGWTLLIVCVAIAGFGEVK